MTTNLQLKVLTSEEVSDIYGKCIDFLSSRGWIKIDSHPQALKMLDKAGAQVDFGNQRVRFPRDVIEEALRTVPHSVTLAGQIEENDLILPHPEGLFYIRNNSGARSYVEPDSNTARGLTLADVAEWGQLAEALNEINVCAHPFPLDVPGETADIHGVKTLLENTSKHIFIQVYSSESIEYLFELAIAVTGNKDALKKRPIISMGPVSTPPFIFSAMDVEEMVQACRYGVPMFLCAGAYSAGATSPITIAGTILQSGIETLAMLVMSQLFQPGSSVIAMPIVLTLDMSTGILRESTIEAILSNAASIQFIKEAFHIPTHTWGFGTDSYIPGGQCMSRFKLRR